MSHICCRNRQRCVLRSPCPGFITWPWKITLETFVAFLCVFKSEIMPPPPPLYNSVSPCLLPFFCQNCCSSLSKLNFLTVSELSFSLEPIHQWYSCAHSHFKGHIGLKKKEKKEFCLRCGWGNVFYPQTTFCIIICLSDVLCICLLHIYIYIYSFCLLSSHWGGLIVNDLQYWSYYVKICSG